MGKMLNRGYTVLFLSLVVLVSCTTLPVKPITQADLPDLKGEWKGFYDDRGGTYTQPIELTILGEELNGSWTWHHANRPSETYPFRGKIENGRIKVFHPGAGQINLSLRKGEGKMKLEGDYQFERAQGAIHLNKVK
jgi:hypothetical protein